MAHTCPLARGIWLLVLHRSQLATHDTLLLFIVLN
jgi:hypothetical protein